MSEACGDTHPHRATHDIGGVPRFLCSSIDTAPHALSSFDRRVDALRQLLAEKGLMTVDELRRGIEALPPVEYEAASYYERWIRSIAATLIRRGVIDAAALQALLVRQAAG